MKSRVGSYVLPALSKMNVAVKKNLVSGIFLIPSFCESIEEGVWRKHA